MLIYSKAISNKQKIDDITNLLIAMTPKFMNYILIGCILVLFHSVLLWQFAFAFCDEHLVHMRKYK